MNPREPVWITGVGTGTPLGFTPAAFAEGLLAGRCTIDSVRAFDVSNHPCQVASLLPPVPCPPEQDPAAFAQLPPPEQLARWCVTQALQDAGLWERRRELRVALVLGLGADWLRYWEWDTDRGGSHMYRPAEPYHDLVQRTRLYFGLSGPAGGLSAACASANFAIAQARAWLDLGLADVAVTGACDAAVTPMAMAAFGNLRALSRRNHDPQGASRPFDRERDGFVMGEGGAVFVLERASHARARGASVYAAVAGFGATSDAYNMVIPCPEPDQSANAIRQALADARLDPAEVNYVNAHATSTPVGDTAEAKALQMVFGEALPRVPVSSTKGMTGHLLTAAAAVEALACVVAMGRGALPPTINLHEPDPDSAPLCHVANEARPARVRVAMSNSFGFGGSNTCLVLKAA